MMQDLNLEKQNFFVDNNVVRKYYDARKVEF